MFGIDIEVVGLPRGNCDIPEVESVLGERKDGVEDEAGGDSSADDGDPQITHICVLFLSG